MPKQGHLRANMEEVVTGFIELEGDFYHPAETKLSSYRDKLLHEDEDEEKVDDDYYSSKAPSNSDAEELNEAASDYFVENDPKVSEANKVILDILPFCITEDEVAQTGEEDAALSELLDMLAIFPFIAEYEREGEEGEKSVGDGEMGGAEGEDIVNSEWEDLDDEGDDGEVSTDVHELVKKEGEEMVVCGMGEQEESGVQLTWMEMVARTIEDILMMAFVLGFLLMAVKTGLGHLGWS